MYPRALTWLALRELSFPSAWALDELNIRQAPIPVFHILEGMGVNLHFVSGDPGWEAASRSTHEGQATIWVRSDRPTPQQRLAAAHELGHMVLHELGREFRDLSIGWCEANLAPQEREASAFAGALLMPRFLFQPLIYHSRATLEELANHFEVPVTAVAHRFEWMRSGKQDF